MVIHYPVLVRGILREDFELDDQRVYSFQMCCGIFYSLSTETLHHERSKC